MFKRNKTLAGILAIFLGTLGIHKFYQGKWKAGIAYFLFFWTGIPTILGILDGAKLLTEVADEVPDESAPAKKEKAVNIENKKDANKDNTEKSAKLDKVAKSEKSSKLDKSETVKETGKTEKTDKSDEITKSEKSEKQTKSKAENKTEDKTENKAEKKSENKPEKRNMKSRLSDLKNHDDSEEDEDDYDDTEE